MLISIIIPVHKRNEATLAPLVAQCKKLSKFKGIDLEVIAVFNGYAGGVVTKEILRGIDKFKFFKKPLIIGKARNIGTTLSKGEFLVFIDSDVIIPKSTISKLPSVIRKMTKEGYVALLPIYQDIANKSIYANLDSKEDVRSYKFRINNDGKTASSLSGPFTLISRLAFLKVGGWEENHICAEDKDLAARLLLSGKRIMFSKDIIIYHKNHDTLSRIIKRKIFHAKCNALVYERYPQYFHRSLSQWIGIISRKYSSDYPLQSTLYTLVMIGYVLLFELLRLYVRFFYKNWLKFRIATRFVNHK